MADVEPPELGELLAYSERSRAGDWSLRSALCRYAQPEPKRVSEVLELVRRIEAAVHPSNARFVKEGPSLWAALEAGGSDDQVVGLLEAMRQLDALADKLVDWAVDRHGKHPEADVDATTRAVAERLDALGVPREERTGPPRGRAGRG